MEIGHGGYMSDSAYYVANDLDAHILYADNHLLFVDKPAGMLTQDSGTGLFNMEDWAREWVRVDKQKKGNVFLNAVHRIDKSVSGVVLFARTSKALSRLTSDIRTRNCKKIYHALVEGVPASLAGERKDWLLHKDHRSVRVNETEKGAQRAVLSYRVLKSLGAYSLLEIDLETGRYHQIRIQLASMGHPIVGDEKYGAKRVGFENKIALHHARLEVQHPISHELCRVDAKVPGWIDGSLASLMGNVPNKVT